MKALKKIIFILLLFNLYSAVQLFAADNDSAAVRRLGMFIGCNRGDKDRIPLLYAEKDAINMAQIMNDLGGIERYDTTLLLKPTTKEISSAFSQMKKQISAYNDVYSRVEIIFYYSGHSDETGLLLGPEQLRYKTLRDELKDLDADVTVAIIDACSSGAFTRSKGGKKVSPFLLDDSTKVAGHAYLTSSSADEASQEADSIQGSFFTYYLLSGLRGAADDTRDGRVTLNEIYKHTYDETLNRTELTLGGPQHPNYEIQLTGTGDLVLTDINENEATVLISEDISGRLYIRNEAGHLVAELFKQPGVPIVLALPADNYSFMAKTMDGETKITEFTLENDRQYKLFAENLNTAGLEYVAFRGSSDDDKSSDEDDDDDDDDDGYSAGGYEDDYEYNDDFDEDDDDDDDNDDELSIVPFNFSFFPNVSVPPHRGRPVVAQLGFISTAPSIIGCQVNILGGEIKDYGRGTQLSSIFNMAGDFKGFQSAGLFSKNTGYLLGAQMSGLFNTASNVKGGQIAGLFNINSKSLVGVQFAGLFNTTKGDGKLYQAAGLYNTAGNLHGGQTAGLGNISGDILGIQMAGLFGISGSVKGAQLAGLFNHASGDVTGVQISGLFNIARETQGVQMAGLFNYSKKSSGVLIGLVNISEDMEAFPIGIVNWSKTGIFDPGVYYDSQNNITVSLKSGNDWFYSLLYMQYNMNDIYEGSPIVNTNLYLGAGLGVRARLGKMKKFYLDNDLSMKWEISSTTEDNNSWELVGDIFPWNVSNYTPYQGMDSIFSYRLTAGYEFSRFFALEGGLILDLQTPLQNPEVYDDYAYGLNFGPDDMRWGVYPTAYIGVRF